MKNKIIINDLNLNFKKEEFRIPIVSIMGHVNHGKTSLLEKIISKNLTKYEIGNITQHIKTYYIKTKNGKITFIDTPGHKIFNNMRLKAIKISDIIILIISIDDGVMPQTEEIVKNANLLKIKIIVVINKIDKIKNNEDFKNKLIKIQNKLNKFGILPEEIGGNNIFINLSCKTGKGIKDLLYLIILQSEVLNLNLNYNCKTKGTVIESYLNKNNILIALIIINKGILYINDIVFYNNEYRKIIEIYDNYGNKIIKVKPSFPVEVIGLSENIKPGDIIKIVKKQKIKNEKNKNFNKLIYKKINKKFKYRIILKSDVKGTLETILDSILKLNIKNKKIKVIYSDIGKINKKDINLSLLSKSTIITFNIYNSEKIINILKKKKIKLKQFDKINKLIKNIKKKLKKIKNQKNKKLIGIAKIKNIYIKKKYCIAGCIIKKGKIKIKNFIKILDGKNIIYRGKIESLKIFKKNVKEVNQGSECGIKINFNKIKINNIIKIFKYIKN